MLAMKIWYQASFERAFGEKRRQHVAAELECDDDQQKSGENRRRARCLMDDDGEHDADEKEDRVVEDRVADHLRHRAVHHRFAEDVGQTWPRT